MQLGKLSSNSQFIGFFSSHVRCKFPTMYVFCTTLDVVHANKDAITWSIAFFLILLFDLMLVNRKWLNTLFLLKLGGEKEALYLHLTLMKDEGNVPYNYFWKGTTTTCVYNRYLNKDPSRRTNIRRRKRNYWTLSVLALNDVRPLYHFCEKRMEN